jgi:cell division transport system permease protein
MGLFMKFLKNVFAFLIPLLSMLIAFSIFLLINNVVDNYKTKISRDYSIVIVTTLPLEKDAIKELAGIKVERIQNLPNDKIISSIKSTLSDTSIELLKQKLPNFYQIYLEIFPTSSELDDIKETLLQNKNIRKVEVFYKNHNQIYLLLLLLNTVSFILFFIIALFAIIIIAKQIKLWFHEQNVKISILRLHGASILYSASSILNYAMLSSLLSFLISAAFLYYVSNNMTVLFPIELHEIVDININIFVELMKIFLLSFSISIFTIFGVLLKYKINND